MKQSVYEASSAQNYPLGTRYAKRGDPLCRAWRYTKLAVTTRVAAYGAAFTGGIGLFSKAVPLSITPTTGYAQKGATTVTTTTTMVAGAYAGGLFTMWEDGQPKVMMLIISNTASVILLESPLQGTYTSSASAFVTPGPYKEVIIPGVNCGAAHVFEPCVGIFNSPLDKDGNVAVAGDYVWTQTWGPCPLWASATYEGDLGGQRSVYMCGDGAANISVDIADATRLGYQWIGFLYTCTGPAADPVADHPAISGGVVTTMMKHIVFLQITP